MKYTPLKISIYIFVTLLAFFGIMYLSDSKVLENGKYQEGFFIGKLEIKYPKSITFLGQEVLSKTDVKELDSIVNNIEELIVEEVKEEEKVLDVKFERIIPDLSNVDTSKVQRIYYPNNRSEFIKKLSENLQSNNCRIIHYGDSQLEGDRISAYLRNRLQGFYGGSGPGFVPIVQVYEQISNHVVPSENWTRHAYFDPTQKKLSHKKYGAYSSFSRFSPAYESLDSLQLDSLKTHKATIKIGVSNKSYNSLKKFTKIGLHYGNAIVPTTVKVYNDGSLIKNELLINDGNYHNFIINLATTPSNLKIELESKISPDFYGLTLDGNNGVNLDNVAMRGSSGTIFASTDGPNFQQMYNQLQPKVIIFQYGGNTVPYIKDSLQVTNYARYLKNHLNWVRNKSKNASIIFVGPADMSTSENGQIKTYPLLPYLNETLKKMCNNNDIAYWSIYEAMGGENSMAHWVEQKLAASDYTHFSASGTKIISELLFISLFLDLKDKK